MSAIVGIDLGTTNSVVAHCRPDGTVDVIAGPDGSRIVPSAIYLPEDGGDPIVGGEAVSYALLEPDRVARVFKRGMGTDDHGWNGGRPFVVDGTTWTPEQLSAILLRRLVDIAGEYLGEPVTQAVVTVPAYFGDPERAATRAAAEIAGLDLLRIVNEPTAAAVAHGLDRPGVGRTLVFDLGGGTFDLTVMDSDADGALRVLASGGDHRLGGVDIDARLVDHIADTYVLDIADPVIAAEVWASAEQVKKTLSAKADAKKLVCGQAVELDRFTFDSLIGDLVSRIEDMQIEVLEEAAVEPSGIGTVLMVGGSSRIPVIVELLRRTFRVEPTMSRNLDEDVARGAAMVATKTAAEAESGGGSAILDPRSALAAMPAPVDAATHGVGLVTHNMDTREPYNDVVIPKGTPLPATRSVDRQALDDEQKHLLLEVTQGDDTDLRWVDVLGKANGAFDAAVKRGHPLRVDVTYTADQEIHAAAYDRDTGALICELRIDRTSGMDSGAIASARAALAGMDVAG